MNASQRTARLSEALTGLQGSNPLVLGFPEESFASAEEIARDLDGQADSLLLTPLYEGRPSWVSEWGDLEPDAKDEFGNQVEVARRMLERIEDLLEARARLTPGRGPLDPRSRVVLLVAGEETSAEKIDAAMHVLMRHQPSRLLIIVAPTAQERSTSSSAAHASLLA